MEIQNYRGKTYKRYRGQKYFKSGANILMHREVWAIHHGPIPAGHAIHHRDHDRANNKIENLELVTTAEHNAAHYRARPDLAKVCTVCQTSYTSKDYRSIYCTKRCNKIAEMKRLKAARRGFTLTLEF